MARMRFIKPGFFRNEDLGELSMAHRLAFAGLWTEADKAGRLEDRPKRIKADLFPYDDVDMDALLDGLADRGFICRYVVDGVGVIQVLAWERHQRPRDDEPESKLPQRPDASDEESKQERDKSVTAQTPPQRVGVNGVSRGSAFVLCTGDLESTHTAREAAAPQDEPRDKRHEHRAHAWCGRVACVPQFLHDELLAGVRERKGVCVESYLLGHYAEDDGRLASGELVLDQAPVGWWRHRCFEVWLGGPKARNGRRPATRGPTAPHASSCPHAPPCATVHGCIERTLAEGRAQRQAQAVPA